MNIFGQLESAQTENLAADPTTGISFGRIFYDTVFQLTKFWNGASWARIHGEIVQGSTGAPTAIVAAGATPTAGGAHQLWFVVGNNGTINAPVTVTGNPRIAAGTAIGQKMKWKGTSDTNTVRVNNGNGMSQDGDILLGLDDTIQWSWDGTNWSEDYRRQ